MNDIAQGSTRQYMIRTRVFLLESPKLGDWKTTSLPLYYIYI